MTTYYSTGTASVSNGGTTVTGSGTAWASVVQAGDLFLVPAQGLVAMITAVASNTSITIDAWPGTTISGAAYKIVFASDAIRQSERARRYAEIASQIANTGIGIDAFGDFTDRATYNAEATGFAFLSFDGDGASITDPVIFLKNSSTSADWSAAVEVSGPPGATGDTGLIGVWKGPWLTATAYAVGDAVSQAGSSYICLEAHTSGTFSTDLAASKWEIVAQKGDTGATGAAGTNGTNGTNGVDGTGLFSRVRAAAASNITIATALNNGDTIDGVTLATNDLVLVAGQTAPAENGVYVVGASPARDSSFDTYDEHPGVYISVMEGTTYADTLWRCTSNKGGTLDTTAITWSQFTGGTSVPFTAASSSGPAQLDLAEDTDNGSNKVALKAPSALTADRDFILPDASVTLTSYIATLLNSTTAAGSQVAIGVREVLTANRTYYVRTDGSDSNNGLADTSGGAFLTIQKAVNVARALDLSIYTVTISIGSGTFAENVTINSFVGGSGTQCIIQGAGRTSTTIGSGSGTAITVSGSAVVSMGGFTVATGASIGINADNNAVVTLASSLGSIGFPACSSRTLNCAAFSRLAIRTDLYIGGNTPRVINAQYRAFVELNGTTIYTTTAITVTEFCQAHQMSSVVRTGTATFDVTAGAVTGKRHTFIGLSLLDTAGTGATFFPGSTAGTEASGSQQI